MRKRGSHPKGGCHTKEGGIQVETISIECVRVRLSLSFCWEPLPQVALSCAGNLDLHI